MNARLPAIVACALFSALAAAQSPSFHLVGIPPGGSVISEVSGLSVDGSIAAGAGHSLNVSSPGFTWTAAGGRDDFGLLPGSPIYTTAHAISGDGDFIAGEMYNTASQNGHAYRRAENGLLEDLGVFTGYTRGSAYGISGDGSVVVGKSERGQGNASDGQAFRWTSGGGMQGLGYLRPGGSYSRANAVSLDGSTIVGSSKNANGNSEAFVWTAEAGMQPLAGIPNAGFLSAEALGTSADGGIIVGESRSTISNHAVRWSAGQAFDLGTLGDYLTSTASDVSDDGSVIVGYNSNSQTDQFNLPFVWTESGGMSSLSDYLAANGLTIPDGCRLLQCYAISGDGFTFAGRATFLGQPQGFVATIPAPSSFLVMALLIVPASRRRRMNGNS